MVLLYSVNLYVYVKWVQKSGSQILFDEALTETQTANKKRPISLIRFSTHAALDHSYFVFLFCLRVCV